MLIIGDIAVVDALINNFGLIIGVIILGLFPIVPLIMLKVISEGGVVAILDGLELSVGVEAEHCAEGVIDEAEDGISVYVFSE